MPTRAARAGAVLTAVLLTAACTSSGGRAPAPSSPAAPGAATAPTGVAGPGTSARPSTAHAPSTRPSTQAASGRAAAVLAAMTERQRVGQLLVVDCPSTGVGSDTASAVTDDAVGSIILDGTTHSGASAIRAVTRRLQQLAPQGVGLLVATDQEGGLVQRLQGPGFDTVPDGPQQGALSPSALRSAATRWGGQLAAVGVDVDLAPVLDTVPSGGGSNPPIGDLDREFGHDPATVTSHGLAVAAGLTAAGVLPTVKHFPGLGRVTGNTDTASGVTDTVTTRTDPYLAPFRAAVQAQVPIVMISTAVYSRIDPGTPAAFSATIIGGMLRGDLGFRGLVVSDDLGAAAQVSALSPGERAVRFVDAGGDLVLTVVAGQAQAMTTALLAEANRSASFRRKVDAAALLVLQAKQRAGLL